MWPRWRCCEGWAPRCRWVTDAEETRMLKEFKEFAIKGNMVDMAVGIIIGAAFGTVVTSLVNDLLMPVISGIIGTPDFSNLFVILRNPTRAAFTSVTAARDARPRGLAFGLFLHPRS